MPELEEARKTATIVSVQNLYNVADRSGDAVVSYAEAEGLAFVPFFPLARGKLADPHGPLAGLAAAAGSTPSQLALAWLLRRSRAILPIPGATTTRELTENVGAGLVHLSAEHAAALEALAW